MLPALAGNNVKAGKKNHPTMGLQISKDIK